MNIIRVSATSARNKFFELLNQVAQGAHVVIEKDNKEVALISPRQTKIDWKKLQKATDLTHSILPDFNPMDNPLRKSADYLGKWDKDLIK